MKKNIATIMGLAFVFSVFLSCQAFANNRIWTDTLTNYLNTQLEEIEDKKSDFSSFVIYDIEDDGILELILRSPQNQYRLVRIENFTTSVERTFTASRFFETYNGDFVIEYGDENTITFVKYAKEKSLVVSDQLFRERKNQDKWVYFNKTKEVSKADYDFAISDSLIPLNFTFVDVSRENIDAYVYAGDWAYGPSPIFTGTRLGGVYGAVTFPDGTKGKFGIDGDAYGLLTVNGNIITEVFPINKNGRTLIPVRAVSENLNARVSWVGNTQKVIVEGKNTIEMYIGDTVAYVNGNEVEMDVPAEIIAGSTYVPVRFVAENLDAEVFFWEGAHPFAPVVAVESKNSLNTVSEKEALNKVQYFLSDVEWTSSQSPFVKSFMIKNLSFKTEGLIAGRYWSIFTDVDKSQRIWIDQYTGRLFSVYQGANQYGIEAGIDAVIESLVEHYIG